VFSIELNSFLLGFFVALSFSLILTNLIYRFFLTTFYTTVITTVFYVLDRFEIIDILYKKNEKLSEAQVVERATNDIYDLVYSALHGKIKFGNVTVEDRVKWCLLGNKKPVSFH
jgi:hypothetical protein